MFSTFYSLLFPFLVSGFLYPFSIELSPEDILGEITTPQWTCAEPHWIGEPVMVGEEFVAVLENDCQVTVPYSNETISHVADFFIDGTQKAKIIHSGPLSREFEGLASVFFDVTVYNKGSEEVTIRQDVNIASDQKSKLIYDMKSTSCEGTGLASYLRFVHTHIQVSAQTQLQIRLSNEVRVEKPWYAPESIFIKEAKKSALDQFSPLRADLMNAISSHL